MSPYGRVGSGPFPTAAEAKDALVPGWNLRCNRCGWWGALWFPGQRAGWGALALCDPHSDELFAELRRHGAVMAELRKVNFEQP